MSIRVEAGLKLVGDSKCGRVIKVEAKNIVGLWTELHIQQTAKGTMEVGRKFMWVEGTPVGELREELGEWSWWEVSVCT